MILLTSFPLVLWASSPAFSKSRNARRMTLWSSLSMTMASVDTVVLLVGGGLRTRASGTEVGGFAESSYGGVLAQPRDLVQQRIEGDRLVLATPRQQQHAERVPLAGRSRPGQVVGLRATALGREQHRSCVGLVGQEGREGTGLGTSGGGEHEPGDPPDAGRGEEDVPAAALPAHPDRQPVDVG